MFHLRTEYREYLDSCREDNTTPNSFRDWFDVTYWYEWLDELPTGEQELVLINYHQNKKHPLY